MSEATTLAVPRQIVRSPEQVVLDLPIAGPMSRMLAFSVDYGIVLIVELLLFLALLFSAATVIDLQDEARWLLERIEGGGALPGDHFRLSGVIFFLMAIFVLVDFVLQWTYFVVCELLMRGSSPGKAMMGLRVVREGGLPITPRDSLVRNLARMVDMLPSSYFVGLVAMVVSRRTQRLGDIAAGTIVVREDRPEPAAPIDTSPSGSHAPHFRFAREEVTRVAGTELRLIRQTLRRLESLSTLQREAALARATEALCQRIGRADEVPPAERQAFLIDLLRASGDA